jgi:DGQHR domain-containing protein
VWSLLYKLGFAHLSGETGAELTVDKSDDKSNTRIDVVGVDRDVAIAAWCRAAEKPHKYTDLEKEITKLDPLRQRFAHSVGSQYPGTHKRVPIIVLFTWDLLLSDSDAERAKDKRIALLNEKDLAYYELLASHLGEAAKYQFFADMLPGRQVPGLELRVPALQGRLGKYTYYTFSIQPEYLLKIAYVSHRAKGKATDVDTYQRMIKKSRLKKIREYIDENGIFPTNIVVNLEGKRRVNFEAWTRSDEDDDAIAKHGTLILATSYKSAWIIDGQHRLYAYSGHRKARTSHLSVLAFDGLPASKQAQLFIDINHEQKSVKRGLLQQLYAELNWDAEDDDRRVNAIVSKAVQALNEDKSSPFFGRILLADETRTERRCITLESLFRTLNQPGLFVIKQTGDYGPLWAGENEETLKRVIRITNGWFTLIREANTEWWDAGSAPGGGLAMNDGVSVCMMVLKAVFEHLLDKKHGKLTRLSADELLTVLRPYGDALAEHFANYSDQQRQGFRAGARGNQGQTAMRRKCEKALKERFHDFDPPGLMEALKAEEAQTNEHAYRLIVQLEKKLSDFILNTLRLEFGENWWNAIPLSVRKKAMERYEEEQGRAKKESYLDLIDFRNIALNNWSLFQDTLGFGKSGNKDTKTEWIQKLNEARKVVMHPAKQQTVSFEQLAQIEEYSTTLDANITGDDTDAEPQAAAQGAS